MLIDSGSQAVCPAPCLSQIIQASGYNIIVTCCCKWLTVIKQLNNVFLQADNKLDVLQSLMLHNILVKKKAILDQFRKGLSILGLLDEIQRKPEMFEECFVYQGIVSNDSVASSLHFPASEDKNAQRVFQLLQTFIKNCNADGLDDFLRFVTGTRCSAKSILPRRITVSCESTNSIFASTCLLELKLPNHFRNYAEFEAAMHTVIGGNTFTTGWNGRVQVMNSQKCTVCTLKLANVVVKKIQSSQCCCKKNPEFKLLVWWVLYIKVSQYSSKVTTFQGMLQYCQFQHTCLVC